MDHSTSQSFFSVSFGLILVEKNLPYDLYINSSSHVLRERFVRIFPMNGRLSAQDLEGFRRKYHQLYVPEKQREFYLKSLTDVDGVSEVEKVDVIKNFAIGYLNTIFDPTKEFTTEVLNEAIDGCRDSVETMIDTLQDCSIKDVKKLIGNLSFHDFYTYDHSINVSMYCISILKAIDPKADRTQLVLAGLGGLLHDLGKIKIPTHIINNPGKLSDEEFDEIKRHPEFGIQLLDENPISTDGVDFKIIQRIIYEHHENYNGTGYPSKMDGKKIHKLARICAIADFFDAITTKRSYHDVLSVDEALKVMARTSGRKIDPEIFAVFVSSITKDGLQGKSNKLLEDDFDPCRPHNVLPFISAKAEIKQKDITKDSKEKNFGKVSGADDLFGKKKKVS
jgi:HD-GYP domain-containing protein (c-di-GMP phosphodiesterase class II)